MKDAMFRPRLNAEEYKVIQDYRKGNHLVKKKSAESDESTEDSPNKGFSAIGDDGRMMDIDKYCDKYSLPKDDIKSYKLVTHTGTPYYNTHFIEKALIESSVLDLDFIDSVVKKHINRVEIPVPIRFSKGDDVTRLIFTDVHVGMEVNPEGKSLYGGKWDREELMRRAKAMVDSVATNSVGSDIVVDDLGDLVDGWNGQTARGGHGLPQNMSNEEAFDAAVEFKVYLADHLVNLFKNVTFNNINDDNHSGQGFAYVVNSAVKKILEAKYDNVKVVNHMNFINHYFVGDHCFVISHGKDAANLKFGFKPILDAKQAEKIDAYLKANEIYSSAKFIEFSSGDCHQFIADYSTSQDFDYIKYPAFSPSSNWAQTNFKRGISGFVVQNIDKKTKAKGIYPHFFKWNHNGK